VFIHQQTIAKELIFSGIGLHSGKSVKIKLLPGDEDDGINFLINNKKIKALWKKAEVSQLCTKLKENNQYLSTIEHLMSALSGLGISNLNIETSSEEMPILDGSAKDYVDQIINQGIIKQSKPQKILKIKKKNSYKLDDKFIEIEPTDKNELIINYTIDYKDDFIKKQKIIYKHSLNNYKDIYKARTFCLHKDLEKIFSLGLAKGGSLDNAIVVSGKKILNQGGLRNKKEFVNHKILDCMGDIYLSGYRIIGKIKCSQGGHKLTNDLMRKVFEKNDNFSLVEINEKNLPNAIFGKQYLKSIA